MLWQDRLEFSMELTAYAHYNDVIMSAMASQITSLTIVYSIIYSGADQRKHESFMIWKHQSSLSLAFARGIHRWPLNSPNKGPVTRKMFPFDEVIMHQGQSEHILELLCQRKFFSCTGLLNYDHIRIKTRTNNQFFCYRSGHWPILSNKYLSHLYNAYDKYIIFF